MSAPPPVRARAAGVIGAALLALGIAAGPAAGAEVDAAAFAELAARAAAGDPAALDDLLDVDAVDGRPVDAAGLVGPDDQGRPGRLRALAAGPESSPPDAEAARAAAAAILAERRFGGPGVIGGTRSLWARLVDLLDDMARRIFLGTAGDSSLLLLTAIAVVVASAIIGYRLARRHGRAGERTARPGDHHAPVAAAQPSALEDAAEQAERAGDYVAAIRLRFQAGLLRLDRRGLVRLDPALTTGRLARIVAAPGIDGVTRQFDEVVYGGRPATATDATAARSGWEQVLARRRAGAEAP